MFLTPGRCPVCYAACDSRGVCPACGCRAELYFEGDLPPQAHLDAARVQHVIDAARARLAQNPGDGVARYTLGLGYVHLNLISEGLDELRKAAQLLPEKVGIRYEWSALAMRYGIGDDSVILTQLDAILKQKPDFKEALYLRSMIHQKKGQTRQAVRDWQVAYQIDPHYAPTAKLLADFIATERPALTPESLNDTVLDPVGQASFKLLTSSAPSAPASLGKTCMEVVRMLSEDTAQRMGQMHADKEREYQVACKKREAALQQLEADPISLSNLCLANVEARQQRRIAAPPAASRNGPRRLTIQERSAVLEGTIQNYQKSGFRLISRTETTAQLYRPKQFSCCLAIILVFLVIGIILYALYYATKKDDTVYLEVDEFGHVRTTYS